jgi:hypothetical protein
VSTEPTPSMDGALRVALRVEHRLTGWAVAGVLSRFAARMNDIGRPLPKTRAAIETALRDELAWFGETGYATDEETDGCWEWAVLAAHRLWPMLPITAPEAGDVA